MRIGMTLTQNTTNSYRGNNRTLLVMAQQHDKIALRGQIIGLKRSGFSVSAIAHELGITNKTVNKWWRRWEAEGNLRDRPRSGAPRLTTPDDNRRIIEEATAHPLTDAVSIRDRLHLQVSGETVRRRLREGGLRHRIPATKEKLTARHRLDRLRFAETYVNEGLDFWGRVIFSDEKTFSSSTHGPLHCYRRPGTRYLRENIFEIARSGHVTCNVWGWIHLYGIGELTEIEGRFTSQVYLELLEEVMIPSVRAMALPYPERIVFMQVRHSLISKQIT